MKDIKLGSGLFSEVSKALATSTFKIQHIPFESLNPNNDEHGFSLDGIEELAESIADVGLEQNLVVEDSGGDTYNILTGRRRYYAIKLLLERGNTKYKTVPCIVKRLSDIDLPIDDETKRIYAIVTTNTEQRKPTAADTAEMIRKLNIVYDALEEAGAKPKGRRRDFIAKELGISPSTVGRYEYIEKNSDENTKAELKEGKTGLRKTIKETKNKNCAHVSTIEQNINETSCVLRKESILNIPYDSFTEEQYLLDSENYNKAIQIIFDIRKKYAKLAKLIENGKKQGE